MKVSTICDYLEKIAPLNLQENYDNSGLIIGNLENKISSILICLDCTEEVIEEALTNKCNLIISHHPIIFSGIKKINGNNYTERAVVNAIKNNLNIYSGHTNFDNILKTGVNEKIAKIMNLKKLKILLPHKQGLKNSAGAGIIGLYPKAITESEFLKVLKTNMKTECIRHTKFLEKKIKKVAICGGSGSFLLKEAINQNADVFVSSDFKYHQFFDADKKILIADIGHYESEQFTKEVFYELLIKKFPTFAVKLSKINTNPIKYLTK